jgi:pimeloyl-ACP methyl ester carboxylesterase
MLFKEYGDKRNKTVILLHGGGLTWWTYLAAAEALLETYHVVTPVIDGHGEEGGTLFVSVEASAEKLIRYIDAELGGRVFAIGGLSLGAKITVEVLTRRPDIAEYAVIESALVIPMKGTKRFYVPIVKASYGLIGNRWFSKRQAESYGIRGEAFEQYYEDTVKISKASLVNLTLISTYKLKDAIRSTTAKTLIIYGSKELGIMKDSAIMLRDAIRGSTLYVAQGLNHGEFSLLHTEEFIKLVRTFLGV